MEWVASPAGPIELLSASAAGVEGAAPDVRVVAVTPADGAAGTDPGRRVVAVVRELEVSPRPAFVVDVAQPTLVDPSLATALVDAVLDLDGGRPHGVVCASDLLAREAARRAGATGLLRQTWLELPTRGAAPTEDAGLAAAVGAHLPEAEVVGRRSVLGAARLTVHRAGDSVRARLPRTTRPMAEPVAAAVDTLFAVRARFGRAAAGVDVLSFDNGGQGFTHGHTAGQAEGGSGVIVLAPSYASVDAEAHVRRARLAQGRPLRPALGADPPMRRIDEVVAHECWHYIDAAIIGSGADYVAFNAAIGEALGVESLELALRGAAPDAPTAWRDARARLVDQVSEYASTNPREATAEMFSQWWCRGEGRSAVVERFGELVERYFPRVG